MRAIFLDRDGVICENRSDHVKSWSEFKFLPGVKNNLAKLSSLELPIVVVTNQAVIGRGLASAETVEEIHHRMVAEITAAGGRIDRVYTCPHLPEAGCECRKPKTGLLLQAAAEMGLDLTQSYLIGDAVTDILAGQQVGCRTFLVLTGRGVEQLVPTLHATNGRHFTVVRNLLEVADHLYQAEVSYKDSPSTLNFTYLSRYRQALTLAGI
jgi:D-glycero-D-manno-heptose 1,7-bisphosphate phosphatase